MITLIEFLNKYLGQSKGYPDGQYVGECLSIVKLYIKECFGINPPPSGTNSAYGYWSNFPSPLGEKFEKVENNPDLIPLKGWIVIWKPWTGNSYGHIAIVKDANLNIFNSYDQNWGTKIFKEINHNYDNVIGFLKPKSSIIQEDMTDEQKRILEFLNGKTEGQVREAFGALNDLPSLNKKISDQSKQIEVLDGQINSLTKQVNDLTEKFNNNEKSLASYQSDLKTANKTISNLTEENTKLSTERSQYKSWYESALKDQVNKYTGWQLIRKGVQLLIKK